MNPTKMLLMVSLMPGLTALSGCSGIGPVTVVPSRFDYTAAIGDSWKQQMLINMVKVRYGDSLVFLDVASVISQFQITGGANWGGTFNNQTGSNVGTLGITTGSLGGINQGITLGSPFLSDTQNFGVNGTYADRPTITYVPLSGAKFTRTLMKPIPPPGMLSMIQSGYPIDLVLRFCVHSINGIRNRYGGSARARLADPEFYPLVERLRRIQDSGLIGLRITKTKEMEGMVLILRGRAGTPTAEEKEDMEFVRKTLGLDPAASEFNIAYGSVAKDRNEIAMLTRSVLEIIIDMASFIEVPPEHVEEQRVNATLPEETSGGSPVPPLIRIHSSRCRPADAFLAVPYRHHWYWIDDCDMQSKSVLSFLMFVFSLTDTETKEGAPIVTIPTG